MVTKTHFPVQSKERAPGYWFCWHEEVSISNHFPVEQGLLLSEVITLPPNVKYRLKKGSALCSSNETQALFLRLWEWLNSKRAWISLSWVAGQSPEFAVLRSMSKRLQPGWLVWRIAEAKATEEGCSCCATGPVSHKSLYPSALQCFYLWNKESVSYRYLSADNVPNTTFPVGSSILSFSQMKKMESREFKWLTQGNSIRVSI